MFIARVKRRRRRGFTLLEITLAVAILAMMSLTIYRFVATNITVMRISAEDNAAEARYFGFINLLTAQLQDLPSGVGALSGEPFKFNDQAQDVMTWICGSGPGLLTRYAPGEFLVSVKLKRINEKTDKMGIGFLRKPRETAEGETEGESWVPVLDDVSSLQIRYFDSRLNAWVDKWADPQTKPQLVKVVIGLPDRPMPLEAVIALARTPLQLVPMQALQPTQPSTQPTPPQTQTQKKAPTK